MRSVERRDLIGRMLRKVSLSEDVLAVSFQDRLRLYRARLSVRLTFRDWLDNGFEDIPF